MSLDNDQLRTKLAAERTLMAWIRTGLAMMAFGFIVARFGLFVRELALLHGEAVPTSRPHSLWIGIALVVLAIIVFLVAVVQHAQHLAAIDPLIKRRPSMAMLLSIALALLGCVMVGLLLVL